MLPLPELDLASDGHRQGFHDPNMLLSARAMVPNIFGCRGFPCLGTYVGIVRIVRGAYYGKRMIRSFRDREAEKILGRKFSRRLQGIETAARIRLEILDAATNLNDLRLPGLRLEALKGDRQGQFSIRINDQYRVCFRWEAGDAFDVEIVDYH